MRGLGLTLAVAIGGALGALARVSIGEWLDGPPLGPSVLLTTLAINSLGAAALGLLRRPQSLQPAPWIRLGASVGFLGSFTTWSAVMVISHLLIAGNQWLLGVGYLIATLALGLLGAWWGLRSTVGTPAAEGHR